jgi:2-succinyl-5-enolpyruvyl-6-hydroxy-3-cyclohexene-1-carboxylate synthase
VDATNRNTALASAFVEELARCGVRRAVLSPGSRSTPLALALWRQPAIEVTVLIDERSAGFFALGAAQASGMPVPILTTSGTAAANLHPAVAEANESGIPLIVLTADRPPELRGIGAGQTIDQLKLYGDAVRWFCEVGTHDADDAGLLHYRSVACRGFALARGEPRPGPVHLNLAWREPLAPVDDPGAVTATSRLALEGRGERPLTAASRSSSRPDDALVVELADRLASAPRGLILAGRQPDPALADPVAELAHATGYPILAEPTSQLRMGGHDRSQVIWPYDAIARHGPAGLRPDLVVRFGEMPTSKALRQWLASDPAPRQIVVDARGGWYEPSRQAETIVRAEPRAFAAAVAQETPGPADRSWLEGWFRAADSAANAIEAGLAELDYPTEPGTHAALASLYGNGDLVYTASSMPIRDQEAFLPSGSAAVRFLANRGANGIDGLISAGAGAATATGKPTWIVTGDLGLFHDMNGLAAIRGARSPVRIVVLNNDGGGIFEFLPQADLVEREEFEALLGTPSGIEIEKVAALHEIPFRRIERVDELAEATRETALVEVPVDRRRNVSLHAMIAERVGASLAAAGTSAPLSDR